MNHNKLFCTASSTLYDLYEYYQSSVPQPLLLTQKEQQLSSLYRCMIFQKTEKKGVGTVLEWIEEERGDEGWEDELRGLPVELLLEIMLFLDPSARS
eukprot:CAMPEP_0174259324 /NCGR_PEP_ID=MMETSP0439-20130205/8165_1 /TAXON_ID=0 /ORGANISM="Stereomyxa ramosa, Strain Chinc5" /LENGTH=96 /DNA_ID=CAMNT_0015343155 /DNA_START=108 /DNA_END=394 /DNA_ORIENTATION=-